MQNTASILSSLSSHDLKDGLLPALQDLFVNMLAGGLKHHLSKNEEMFKISIPSAIAGRDYATYAPANSRILLVGVSAGPYNFKVQLVIEG